MAVEVQAEAPPPEIEVGTQPVTGSLPPEQPAEVSAAKGSKGSPSKPAKPAKGVKGAKGGKDSKAAKGLEAVSDGPSVTGHPRAARQVARAKGWGGLTGFVLGGYLSLPTNPLVDAGLRALVAGCVCYLAAWAVAVFVWRQLVVIEIKRREQELLAVAMAEQTDMGGLHTPPHSFEATRTRTVS